MRKFCARKEIPFESPHYDKYLANKRGVFRKVLIQPFDIDRDFRNDNSSNLYFAKHGDRRKNTIVTQIDTSSKVVLEHLEKLANKQVNKYNEKNIETTSVKIKYNEYSNRKPEKIVTENEQVLYHLTSALLADISRDESSSIYPIKMDVTSGLTKQKNNHYDIKTKKDLAEVFDNYNRNVTRDPKSEEVNQLEAGEQRTH